ncbi:MAG: 4-amino-4-deoxy-L-arabinose transferase, partial [Isosphaeraceae bacterium]
LVLVNPLYRLHARRAMSDVPCEAFLLLGLLAALWVWRRSHFGRFGVPALVVTSLGGICLGLSLSSKLSGMLGFMVVGIWLGVGVLARFSWGALGKYAAAVTGMTLVAATLFVGLNPFFTARPAGITPPAVATIAQASPWKRFVMTYQLRIDVSTSQQSLFAHNALATPWDKVTTTAAQGFGRFGPFGPAHSDSTLRFDWTQDFGGALWLPWVVLGACWAWARGRAQHREGEPPTAWAVLAQFVLTLMVVTAYVPMAWDRYFLAIQAPSALLAAGLAVAVIQYLRDHVKRRRSAEVVG